MHTLIQFMCVHRAAIEQEKKTRAHNLEFRKAMEEKMVSMAGEIEKLHAELANAERRAMATAVAANPSKLSDGIFKLSFLCPSESGFSHLHNSSINLVNFLLDPGYGGGQSYSEPYNPHQVCP